MNKVRIVVEHQQKNAPDSPVLKTFEIYDVDNVALYEALGRVGFSDDGRFECASIVGGQQLPPDGL